MLPDIAVGAVERFPADQAVVAFDVSDPARLRNEAGGRFHPLLNLSIRRHAAPQPLTQ